MAVGSSGRLSSVIIFASWSIYRFIVLFLQYETISFIAILFMVFLLFLKLGRHMCMTLSDFKEDLKKRDFYHLRV